MQEMRKKKPKLCTIYFFHDKTGMEMRTAAVGAIYRKSLSLSNEAR